VGVGGCLAGVFPRVGISSQVCLHMETWWATLVKGQSESLQYGNTTAGSIRCRVEKSALVLHLVTRGHKGGYTWDRQIRGVGSTVLFEGALNTARWCMEPHTP